jgi:7-cyano-7-deazaguanine synthase
MTEDQFLAQAEPLAELGEPAQVHKVFCLLSGGVDSTTTLAMAQHAFPDDPIECVTVNYGQRHIKESQCAQWQAEYYQADHVVIDAQGLLTGMLVDKGENNEEIPNASYQDLPHGISPTYVSFRNGTMLSLVAARAQGWIMAQEAGGMVATATIYCGIHADDAANDAYPDCTLEFIGSMANAIYVGTYFKVRVRAPLVHMEKAEVVAQGNRLGVDYSKTWSCYVGEDKHCGVCPTCRARKEAFEEAIGFDPTEYAA